MGEEKVRKKSEKKNGARRNDEGPGLNDDVQGLDDEGSNQF